jgi:isoleucyl-tRNA synthetase
VLEVLTDYKNTVNLPRTDFAMKADLARREPAMQKWWDDNNIYGELRSVARGRPRFGLHQGPPKSK